MTEPAKPDSGTAGVSRKAVAAGAAVLVTAILIQAFNIHVLRETIDLVAGPPSAAPPTAPSAATAAAEVPCDKSPPSALATKYLGKLHGIEIGASYQNSFNLPNALNVDVVETPDNQPKGCPHAAVQLVASGDDLPFKDSTLDYVLASHVIEHFFDPIKALKEWQRVIKPGGYIFIIAPHRDRTFDAHREVTPMPELLDRHSGRIKVSDYARPLNQQALEPYGKDKLGDYRNVMPQLLAPRSKGVKLEKGWAYSDTFDDHHWSVWRTDDFVQLVRHLKMDVVEIQDKDDKVGNGFTVVIRKKPLTK